MGQKIRPNSLRLGIIEGWKSAWFPKKLQFKDSLEEDFLIRNIINKKIGAAGIDKTVIERTGDTCRIFIKAQRPGLIIGRGGKGVEDLSKLLEKNIKTLRAGKGHADNVNISLNIEELKRSEISSSVIAQNIAWDIEKRMPFRRTMKKYLEGIMQNREAQGAKIRMGGRLDGGEIARTEHLEKGKLPLQTLRANIDYGEATAFTTYGTVGIKVWIYKGDVFEKKSKGINRQS
ncbi:MAG: 30S ribosomal protein S3 [Candidatus Wolfebacteria bacterium]|nr:30S ribosomal protein S3 [Candidatus Wolfebacteria bacterium]